MLLLVSKKCCVEIFPVHKALMTTAARLPVHFLFTLFAQMHQLTSVNIIHTQQANDLIIICGGGFPLLFSLEAHDTFMNILKWLLPVCHV